ncbi:MAG: anaerobic ribonucleoside-triphosphate reductase activating protein [Bdellovibrionota bacterium]|jgi:pyruvate formate lyase activating enzyme
MVSLEKKTPLYSYMKNPSLIDFPGNMALIFFVNVCNFRCRFCHNRSLLDKTLDTFTYEYLNEVLDKYKDNWVEAVVISGGEPCTHSDIFELVEFIYKKDFKIKLDTNGSFPERLREVLPLVDYVAMDLKASLENYEKLVKFNNTKKILESIEILKQSGKPFELRTTILEDFHTIEEIDKMLPLLKDIPEYYLQAFIPRKEVLDPELRDAKRTSLTYLEKLEDHLKKANVNVKIR